MQLKAVLPHAQHWIVSESACKITYVKSSKGVELTSKVKMMALYDARLPRQRPFCSNDLISSTLRRKSQFAPEKSFQQLDLEAVGNGQRALG